eukprot:TRINITY_DN59168_c0_g1_i1.p1 TRINITY_DN59168_c0_g1~~TRINITY_DN59168_c0_g1_i1.p1  ORF type:complete len:408 (-),score=105.96 TRINITY_DN59168_c0_g1_i1:51-1211(-)
MWPAAPLEGDLGLGRLGSGSLLPSLQAEAAAQRRWGSSSYEFRSKNPLDTETVTDNPRAQAAGAEEDAEELDVCSKRLAAVRAELQELEKSARVKEETHAQELENLASRLLEMDTALHLHARSREEAAARASWKLGEARDELAELHTEVLLAQAEGEAFGAEASAVPAQDTGALPAGWEDWVLADLDELRSEEVAFASARETHRLELLGLEARQRCAEESLRHSEHKVEGYKDWSLSLRAELQQVGSELSEDRQVAARERLRLRARAAELSRTCGEGSTAKAAAANASLRLGLARQGSLSSLGSGEAPAAPRHQHCGGREHCGASEPVKELTNFAPSAMRGAAVAFAEKCHQHQEQKQEHQQQPLWCRKAPPKQGLGSSASAPSLH